MSCSEPSSHWLGWLDRLSPPGYLELGQHEVVLRARITAGTLLLASVCCLAALFAVLGIAAPTPDAPGAAALDGERLALSAALFAYLLDIALFRATGAFLTTAHVFGAVSFLLVHYLAPLLGGFSQNPLLPIVILVPGIVFLIAGRPAGMVWTALSVTYLFVAPFDAPTRTTVFAPEVQARLQVAAWSALAVGVLLAMYVLDLFNTRLRQALADERNRFEFEARHDKLTGILNRSCFQLRLERALERVRADDTMAIVGLLDLDGFKPINDEIGHHAGDAVLVEIAARLQSLLRKTDTLARLGGDEFAFIVEDVDDLPAFERTVRRMLETIAAPIAVDGKPVSVSGSIGLAHCPADSLDAAGILRAADIAMYEAKKCKHCFRHFREVPHKFKPPRVGSRFG